MMYRIVGPTSLILVQCTGMQVDGNRIADLKIDVPKEQAEPGSYELTPCARTPECKTDSGEAPNIDGYYENTLTKHLFQHSNNSPWKELRHCNLLLEKFKRGPSDTIRKLEHYLKMFQRSIDSSGKITNLEQFVTYSEIMYHKFPNTTVQVDPDSSFRQIVNKTRDDLLKVLGFKGGEVMQRCSSGGYPTLLNEELSCYRGATAKLLLTQLAQLSRPYTERSLSLIFKEDDPVRVEFDNAKDSLYLIEVKMSTEKYDKPALEKARICKTNELTIMLSESIKAYEALKDAHPLLKQYFEPNIGLVQTVRGT